MGKIERIGKHDVPSKENVILTLHQIIDMLENNEANYNKMVIVLLSKESIEDAETTYDFLVDQSGMITDEMITLLSLGKRHVEDFMLGVD